MRPWPGDAAGVADGRDRHAEGPAQDYEYQVLVRLAEALPAEVRVRIVADRGFGDQKLYGVLTEDLKFDFVIRFRGNIMVTAPIRPRAAVRSCARALIDLHAPHRVCHAGPIARAPARQQGGTAHGARPPGSRAAHQRLGERNPLPGHQAQSQRRHAKRPWTRLPRCFPRTGQDMRQAAHQLLGLSRQPARGPRLPTHTAPPRTRQHPMQVPLTARAFAPVTFHSPITSAPISSLAASRLSNTGISPPHSAATISIGADSIAGVAMLPRNRVRTA